MRVPCPSASLAVALPLAVHALSAALAVHALAVPPDALALPPLGHTLPSTEPRLQHRFIVVLHDSVSLPALDAHLAALAAFLNGTSVASLFPPSLFPPSLFPPDSPASLRLPPDLVASLASAGSRASFKGVLGRFVSTALRGYHGEFPPALVAALRSSPLVRLVEQDRLVHSSQIVVTSASAAGMLNGSRVLSKAASTETLIQINPAWGLDRITHRSSGFEGRYVYPKDAGANVDVYVLDTGINIAHPDFGGRASFGATFTNDGNLDVNGHGTHVAGIVGSTTYGVAKACNLIAVKVLGNDGTGPVSGIMDGVEWVASRMRSSNRRSVLNLSLGEGGKVDAFNQMIAAVVGAGAAVAVAAGNKNKDSCANSPQDSPVVLTVGASDEHDARADFSNYGPCVGIFAPGTNIVSLAHHGYGTRILSGTSQAAPHVAGQMAVLLGMYPDITPSEVYASLKGIATTKQLSGLASADPDLLLFNGLTTEPLAMTRGKGNAFSLGSGGWILVFQVLSSIWL
ncbi:peptidase S8/S53 domain-containing protein [Entophlyctis helioformis]|nr:peptidase S8/S53 domain-containing protein [Entophlyctis helioformis]